MKKTWMFAIIGLLAISTCIWLLRQNRLMLNSSGNAMPVVKAASTNVLAEAKVVPVQYASLGMAVSGTVKVLLVHEGDVVAPGQALLQIKDDSLVAQVNRQLAALSGVRARLAELKAGARSQERDMVRAACDIANVKLANLPANSAQMDRDIATSEVRRCQAQLDLIEAGPRPETVASLQAEEDAIKAALFEARSALAETVLKAPFAGTITAIDVRLAEQVRAGAPVMQIGDLSRWQIETDDLSELDIARIKVGDEATIQIDGIPGLTMNGRVAKLQPLGVIKAGDVTYRVTIQLDQHDARLRWNMTAAVEIQVD